MTRAENWNLVLQLCAAAQDDVFDCLRIELLNDLGKVDAFSRGPNGRHLAACVRTFFPGKRKPALPQVVPHQPVIFFPAASSSNLQNLLPVARAAKGRNLLGGIVLGEAVQRGNLSVFDEFSPVVSERNLGGRIGVGFLPQSFRRAGRRLKWMLAWLQARDAHCAIRVRQNYGAYLRLMVTAEWAQLVCRNLLATWQPSCVLSTSDFYPFEFQFLWQARKLGIPAAILQHGEPNDVVVWPTYADTFLAWGESYREQFLKRGATQNRLRVTGMPASDALVQQAEGRAATSAKTGKPICLVLSHTQDRIEEAALFDAFGRCLAETIRATPGIQWRIKLHPSEDDSFYRERGLTDMAQVKIEPRDVSLERAVEQASVVCTIRSTAGLQAMMLQKPVIVLDPLKQAIPAVTWPQQGGGIFARDAQTFCAGLNRLVSDEVFLNSVLTSQRQFLDLKFAHRGNAANAVVDFLSEQTRAHKPSAFRAVPESEIISA